MIYKFMIVYKKNELRYNNFLNNKKKIPELILFEAKDSINQLNESININSKYNLLTQTYIDKNIKNNLLGKIGCNISHLSLLNSILQNNVIKNDDWVLILEDDIEINNYNEEKLINVCFLCNNIGSNYIKLILNKDSIDNQLNEKKYYENIYKLYPQYGTTAFLIKKSIIKEIVKLYPIDDNIDIFYMKYNHILNGTVSINNIFINEGANNQKDNESKYGSIIWNNKEYEPKYRPIIRNNKLKVRIISNNKKIII